MAKPHKTCDLCDESFPDSTVHTCGAAVLRHRLATFARGLAAEQWSSSGTYESTVEDKISEAVARVKADIGRALLAALGEVEDGGDG